MAIAVVYITFKDKKEAEKIVLALLKEKLVACANIYPVGSVFPWKNQLKKGKEFVALCKTKHSLINQIEAKVKLMHSYEIPCILSWNAEANREFENWVFESTANLY